MLTSGAMTNRIDRLEVFGLVERLHDPLDRRGVLVSLTKEGLKLIDKAVEAHMVVEEAMLASFSFNDREKFAELLRNLLHDLEVIKRERIHRSKPEIGNCLRDEETCGALLPDWSAFLVRVIHILANIVVWSFQQPQL